MTDPDYLDRLGDELDVFESVVADGIPGQSMSLRAARAQQAGARWGCLLCAWLSLTVETNHCARTLAGIPTGVAGRRWAGLQLLAIFLLATGAFWWLVLR